MLRLPRPQAAGLDVPTLGPKQAPAAEAQADHDDKQHHRPEAELKPSAAGRSGHPVILSVVGDPANRSQSIVRLDRRGQVVEVVRRGDPRYGHWFGLVLPGTDEERSSGGPGGEDEVVMEPRDRVLARHFRTGVRKRLTPAW